ncbi:MAG: serine/threonine protein kinase [Deltaproteobacteria bacterium]|nr:serine/threonine protein kinase [Deltaproteobacteria bacterium]
MRDDDHSADTVLDTDAPTGRALPGPAPRSTLHVPDGERYGLGDMLGKGGMGEVLVARDVRIQREVAIKRMRSELRDAGSIARFLREAHVQGQLEHPAIVPVHDLGVDREGTPYFVMKRLTGVSLNEVLASKDDDVRTRWPRRLLLSRFVDICLAMEFAHRRDIIHRDLKPANLMLGEYGEAYVLDWGLARVGEDAGAPGGTRISGPAPDTEGSHGGTQAGDLLGTPGYMAPEQVRGERVSPKADVYGLGCVLFEILAGAPALPRGIAALQATLSATCHRPSAAVSGAPSAAVSGAEVAPELDDLCARATDADPERRPSARELGEGVQRYLDGDRDEARRLALAAAHARRAEEALAAASHEANDEAGDEANDEANDEASSAANDEVSSEANNEANEGPRARADKARALAMREANSAMVLDPSNRTALAVLGRLLLDAPAAMPAGALAAAEAERNAARIPVMRRAGYGFAGFALVALCLLAFPHKRAWPIVLAAGLTGIAAAVTIALSYRRLPYRSPLLLLPLALNAVALGGVGLVFGPLLLLPPILVGSLACWLAQPSHYRAWLMIAAHFAPLVLLVGLEAVGILPTTFTLDDGRLSLTSWTLDFTPVATTVILVIALIAQCATMTLIILSSRDAQVAAQNRIHAHTWHLRQLVPDDARRPDRLRR